MLTAERRKRILKMIEAQGVVYVPDLSQRFEVSASTIRRDLEGLAAQGRLRRTYGGAVTFDVPLNAGREPDADSNRIGKAAADLIQPDETVFIGPGPLCQVLASALCGRADLTVITNALDVAWTLYRHSTLALIITGGPVVRPAGALVGQIAQKAMHTMRADRLVIEVTGVGPLEGLTTDQPSQAEVIRPLLKSVSNVVVLVAAQKLGRAGAAWLGPVSDADVIITGREGSPSIAWDLSQTGVKVTLV